MVIVEELTAQFHIEFSVELGNALLNVLRLYLEIFLVVETYFHNFSLILVYWEVQVQDLSSYLPLSAQSRVPGLPHRVKPASQAVPYS